MDDANVEDEDDIMMQGNQQIRNQDPQILTATFSTVSAYLQTYGWYLLLGLGILYFLYYKYRSNLRKVLARGQPEINLHRYDDDEVHRRHEAMEEARRRLQVKYSADAEKFQEEQAAKEDEKRKERIADWERHKEGKGYRSKNRFKDSPDIPPSSSSSSSSNQPKKKIYRLDDYNPLGGGAPGSSSYRPPPRGGGGGG